MPASKMDEEVFHAFESFDFGRNETFQEGWTSILQKLGNSVTDTAYLDAKIFFFSKFMKPLDKTEYLLWKRIRYCNLEKANTITERAHLQEHKHRTSDCQMQVKEGDTLGSLARSDLTSKPSKCASQEDKHTTSYKRSPREQTKKKDLEVRDELSSELQLSSYDNYLCDDAVSKSTLESKRKSISEPYYLVGGGCHHQCNIITTSADNETHSELGTNGSINSENGDIKITERSQFRLSSHSDYINSIPSTTENYYANVDPSSDCGVIHFEPSETGYYTVTVNSDIAQAETHTDTSETAITSDNKPSLSLAELAELIQKQKPIPGVIEFDVEPTKTNPTPSTLARKPKPWPNQTVSTVWESLS